MRKAKVTLKQDNIDIGAEVLRALAHPLRLRIIAFIDEHGTINVNQIYNTLNLEQSITSQHLRILRMAGLVDTERDGKFIHYSLNYSRFQQTREAIDRFFEEDA